MTNRQYMYIHLDILKPSIKTNGKSIKTIGKSFGLKLYIHSMTDNIITTSNYTQLQLIELPGYS